MEKNKICTICGHELPLSKFPINRGMPDGHLSKCFKCWGLFTSDKMRIIEISNRKDRTEEINDAPKSHSTLKRKTATPEDVLAKRREAYRRMKIEHPERYQRKLEGARKRSSTPEAKLRARMRVKAWQEEHREEARASVKRWRENNKERYNAYQKKWREENKEAFLKMRLRSAEKKLAEYKKTAEILQSEK